MKEEEGRRRRRRKIIQSIQLFFLYSRVRELFLRNNSLFKNTPSNRIGYSESDTLLFSREKDRKKERERQRERERSGDGCCWY